MPRRLFPLTLLTLVTLLSGLAACDRESSIIPHLQPAQAQEPRPAPQSQAHLQFQAEAIMRDEKPPIQAGATLVIPAPVGSGGTLGKLLDVSSREASGYDNRMASAASATWSENGVPAARFSAQAWMREDGRLGVGYEVSLLRATGSRTVLGPDGKGTITETLTSGPTLSGQVLMPGQGGSVTLGEIHDGEGHAVKIQLVATVEVVGG